MTGAINIRPRASTAATKKTRHAAWLEILESQLRTPPNADTCFAISHTKPIKVTVNNDLTISFSPLKLGAHRYNVRHIENVTPKAKLLVCVNPYAAPAINIIITEDNGAERFVNVEPMNSHAGGYYGDWPKSSRRQELAQRISDELKTFNVFVTPDKLLQTAIIAQANSISKTKEKDEMIITSTPLNHSAMMKFGFKQSPFIE